MSNTQQLRELTITAEEMTQLDQLIGQIPTTFGIRLVDFFRAIQQKRDAEKLKLKLQLQSTPPSTPRKAKSSKSYENEDDEVLY